MLPHPHIISRPESEAAIVYYNYDESGSFSADDGDIFGDGSCLFPNIKCLSRAGFGIVQVSKEGHLLRSIYGTVPASYPQNSLAAEYAALSSAIGVGQGTAYIGDCAEVIRGFHAGPEESSGAGDPFACTLAFGRE